jgi:hypothetical protein
MGLFVANVFGYQYTLGQLAEATVRLCPDFSQDLGVPVSGILDRLLQEKSGAHGDIYRSIRNDVQTVVYRLNSCYQGNENHASFCCLRWYSRHPLQIPPEALDEVWQLPKSIKVEDLGYTSKGREAISMKYSDEDKGFGLFD